MDTWPWDRIKLPRPDGLKITPTTSTVSGQSEAGYTTTRPRWSKNLMKISLDWNPMGPDSFDALLNFFWDQRGQANAFYFQLPIGFFNYPLPFAGGAMPGGTNPFDSEIEVGYGEGPVWIVRFTQDDLPFTYMTDNLWQVGTLELLKI